MFFLLRLTFWIGLVLVLLPTDNKPAAEASKTPEISAGDAMSAAASAVSDFSQFCTRNPQACAVGGQAAEVIGHRAKEGAKKVYQIITDKKSDTTGSIGETAGESEPVEPGTLSASDLEPRWMGPANVPVSAPETVPAGPSAQ
jgi:hypothetical protein